MMRERLWKEPVSRGLMLSAGLVLASCSMTTGSVETEHRAVTLVSCQGFGPIKWSKLDTPETIVQVKGHNAAWKEVCGG